MVGGQRGQGAAVNFAVGQAGQGGQQNKGGRNHVRGQTLGQEGAELAGGWLWFAAGDQVGDELFLAHFVILAGYGRFPHPLMLLQHRFNLPQLNAKAANFYLVIDSAHKIELAVGEPAAQITRPVKFWVDDFGLAIFGRFSSGRGKSTNRSAVSWGRLR
jgi:hypothetical protein